MQPQQQSPPKIQYIDLRSDVVSRAPYQMLKAMSQAIVGDDVYNDDPTANLFQQRMAETFNQQSSIFFPSASMACLSCVIAHCRPGDEMIIWGNSHAVDRQCSNIPMLTGVLTRQLFTQDGTFQPEQIDKLIKVKQTHLPDTTFVFAQNPTYTGHVYPLQKWRKLKQVCTKKNVHLHIDGARIYNALAKYNIKPSQISDLYDSMTICLSKSLCCPTGAVVVGKKKFIDQLRVIRKSLGGGMRQIGILCAAGLYALDHIVPEVAKDNQIALLLGKKLAQIPSVSVDFNSLQTNMVNYNINLEQFDHSQYVKYLKNNQVKIKSYNDDLKFYRLVTYPQIREKEVEKFVELTKKFVEMEKEKGKKQI